MAARKRKSTSQASKPRTPAQEAAQTPPNGVLVTLQAAENGDQALGVQVLGNVKQTEAPTLLELAAKVARGQLGL